MTQPNRTTKTAEAKRLLRNWRAELNSAALYRALAELERHPRQADAFRRLAATEEQHAAHWARHLSTPPNTFKPSKRTRLLIWVARHVGPGLVLPHLARLEQLEADGYLRNGSDLAADEQGIADLLEHLGHHEFSEFVKKVILKSRRYVILVLGLSLFAVSALLARNAQLEGLFFGLLTGVVVGPVTHYLLAKLLIPLPFGRMWCGWACWTAAILDQLPYRKSAGWLPKAARRVRYLHFFLSLSTVLILFFAFGYREGALGQGALLWFVAGNVVYWLTGIVLAVLLKDNRAFCKYVCPVSVIFKQTARPALLKVSGDASACLSCTSQACTTLCPMDIRIPEYILAGERVLSSECVLCQQCVAVCPPNTLGLSFGLDLGGKERLEEREERAG